MAKVKTMKGFPKIYRFITDSPSPLAYFRRVNSVLIILLLTVFLVLFVIVGFDLLKSVAQKAELNNERKKIILEINYWKEFTDKYKGYRDGYFQLAILEYRLNNIEKAKIYLRKVLDLDPNFPKGRELEKILNIK